jgi:hypothetical protein
LPEPYIAKIGERAELISVSDEAAAQYDPDTSVALERASPRPDRGPEGPHGGTALAAPLTIPSVDSLEVREGYIEIVRLPGHELVTSIELLSPCNKYGEGIGEYRHKRRSLVGHGVHVVEIDLLRRGTRTELARPLPPGDYFAFVFRADRRPDVGVYHWGLREMLQPIPVPLRAPDPDVNLELGAIVNTAYDRGRCNRKLSYGGAPPAPALSVEDAAWAAERLRAAGRVPRAR